MPREDEQFLHWQRDSEANARQYFHTLSEMSVQWGLETARTLALMNLTGLAGTATLLAVENEVRRSVLIGAAAFFAAGAVFCIFTMYNYYRYRANYARQMIAAIDMIRRGEEPLYNANSRTLYLLGLGNKNGITCAFCTICGCAALFWGLIMSTPTVTSEKPRVTEYAAPTPLPAR